MIKRYHLIFAVVLLALPLAAFAQDQGFVPLTNIQNLKFAGNQGTSLPDFLNSVYMICIGLGAVIGVLQIMRAGVTWMTAAGSHEKIGDAKNLVRDTIIGLVLILAPTIVFSIINPDILKLEIRGLEKLNRREQVLQNAQTAANIMWVDTETNAISASVRCAQEGGTPTLWCKPSDGSENVPAEGECKGDLFTICSRRSGTEAPSCEVYPHVITRPPGEVCDGSKGETRLPTSCEKCKGVAPGSTCCGAKTVPTSPDNPPPSKIPNDPSKINEACTPIKNGQIIPFNDNVGFNCCNYQDGDGVSCQAVASPDKSKQFCSCKFDASAK